MPDINRIGLKVVIVKSKVARIFYCIINVRLNSINIGYCFINTYPKFINIKPQSIRLKAEINGMTCSLPPCKCPERLKKLILTHFTRHKRLASRDTLVIYHHLGRSGSHVLSWWGNVEYCQEI